MRYSPNNQRWFAFYRDIDELITKFKNVTMTSGKRLQENWDDAKIQNAIPAVYGKTDQLTEVVEKFNEYKQKIDSGGAFKKTRIKISEDKRFTFSFALASKGLIRLPEYYNEQIAQKYPTLFNSTGQAATDENMVAGVVDINQVQSKPLKDGTYFYIIVDNVEYPLRQQQKGTGRMLQLNPLAILLEADDGMYYTMPSFFGDFSLSFSSTFKKSYLEMPKEGGEGRAVDIYVPYDMITGLSNRITPSVPLLLATEYFTQAKIKVRLNIMRPISIRSINYGYIVSIVTVTVKDFNDPIDWNKIAVLRGEFSAGQAITEMNAAIFGVEKKEYSNSGEIANYRNGYAGSGCNGEILYDFEDQLNQEFGRFKNFLRQEVNEGRIKTKLVEKPLMMVFSTQGLLGTEFSQQIIDDVNNSSSIRIRQNFNELIDMVDMFYNTKIGDVVKRVAKRFEEQGKSSLELKNYLYRLVAKLYRDLEPRTGVYASTQEELEKADANYKETISKLEKEFQKRGI
jgi:hypothetical protein